MNDCRHVAGSPQAVTGWFFGKGFSHVTKSLVCHVVCGRAHCRYCQSAGRYPWDAVAGWHTDHNTSSDTWQYYRTDAGTNGYALNTNLVDFGGGQYAWANSSGQNYVCNMPGMPSILDMAPTNQDVATCWQSPITGVVNLSYSLTMPVDAHTNGIEYWVLQGTTQLGHGILTVEPGYRDPNHVRPLRCSRATNCTSGLATTVEWGL